jgi:hypothetical protein
VLEFIQTLGRDFENNEVNNKYKCVADIRGFPFEINWRLCPISYILPVWICKQKGHSKSRQELP